MKFLLTLIFCFNFLHAQNSLLINEIVASNINTYRDEHNNFSDWLELHNNTDNAIDIGGMYLSDDFSNPLKQRIPAGTGNTLIQPDSFIILWADDNPEAGILHLNFQLSAGGEQLIITDSDGITPKKSFRLFFKNGYGQERFEYDLFNLS
jgi:hypothetical protein